MNFKQPLNFDKQKKKLNENLTTFQMCLKIPYYYKKIEGQINLIMKTRGQFMIVMLLNEVVKHPLFKPNLDIGRFCDSFQIFQYSYYSINTTFNN